MKQFTKSLLALLAFIPFGVSTHSTSLCKVNAKTATPNLESETYLDAFEIKTWAISSHFNF